MNRKKVSAIYDALYRKTGSYGDPCTYCGQASDHMDHIPPLLSVYQMSATGAECEGPYVKVPACSECNNYLNAKPVISIKKRRSMAKDHIRKKYKHFLRIPNWDEDELEEMDPSFANEIRSSVKLANHVRARLAWMR